MLEQAKKDKEAEEARKAEEVRKAEEAKLKAEKEEAEKKRKEEEARKAAEAKSNAEKEIKETVINKIAEIMKKPELKVELQKPIDGEDNRKILFSKMIELFQTNNGNFESKPVATDNIVCKIFLYFYLTIEQKKKLKLPALFAKNILDLFLKIHKKIPL